MEVTTGVVRLTETDLPAVRALLATEPVSGSVVAAKLAEPAARRRAVEFLGRWSGDRLSSLCMSGGNVVPFAADGPAVRAYAERLFARGRVCSSILGEADAVLALWTALERNWGPAREVRSCQPLLAITSDPAVRPDPRVRPARIADLPMLLPASVAMYREEVGVSPLGRDGGAQFSARLARSIAERRIYLRLERGEVVFKAEIGTVTADCCQLQGVWVHPDRRGEGLGRIGVAAVVRAALRTVAPTVSLYVNDYNHAARAVYARCGFTQVGTFASVLF